MRAFVTRGCPTLACPDAALPGGERPVQRVHSGALQVSHPGWRTEAAAPPALGPLQEQNLQCGREGQLHLQTVMPSMCVKMLLSTALLSGAGGYAVEQYPPADAVAAVERHPLQCS